MTQYNGLNLKLLNSELNKWKATEKANTVVILRLPPNMIGNSDDESSLPYKLFLTNTQVEILCKSFRSN